MTKSDHLHERTPARLHRAGFTLIESVVAMVIVALMFVAALQATAAVHRLRGAQRHQYLGRYLAADLMSEILQSRYEEPVDVPLFGRESGEPVADRTTWDDVDDYHGLVDAPPRARDGSPLIGFGAWERSVQITPLDAMTLVPMAISSADEGMRRIDVTVTGPGGRSRTVTALRANVATLVQRPTLDSVFVSHVGVDLRLTPDGAVGLTGGANVLNSRLPPANEEGTP